MKIKYSIIMLYLGIVIAAIICTTKVFGISDNIYIIIGTSATLTFMIDFTFFKIGRLIDKYREKKDKEK